MKIRVFYQVAGWEKPLEWPQDLKSNVQNWVVDAIPKAQWARRRFQNIMDQKWLGDISNNTENSQQKIINKICTALGLLSETKISIPPWAIDNITDPDKTTFAINSYGEIEWRNDSGQLIARFKPEIEPKYSKSSQSKSSPVNTQKVSTENTWFTMIENITLKDPKNLDSDKYFAVYNKFNNDPNGRKLLAQLNTTGIPFTQMGSQEKRDYLIAVLQSVPKNDPNLQKITKELWYRTT